MSAAAAAGCSPAGDTPGAPPQSRVLVVMGVSGSGKTTVASMLAGRLGWAFAEGDDFHPAANIEKMHGGVPLDDDDRLPWLHAIAGQIDRWRERKESGVITCSALKRRYRTIIIGGRQDVRLVYLKGARDVIARRLVARHAHFMPASLLQSQFAALEEPAGEERPIIVPVDAGVTAQVELIIAALAPR